ncbi:hypothetical protein ASG17_11640 [Brevundimonas sp. Leaf363]|uniref:hypothetical protein n=1 Tax=Brevundimonas sp. Leaf363 TaxID=1736353 RepID=UPI0006F45912|nr:hypothetical protein [Brevundimonas sp. Leaf363]KQS54293.1 hypothetical protein ASG17_11640 [Brevundimonas sp. Leaf363]
MTVPRADAAAGPATGARRPYLVAYRTDGLGSRILNLAWTWRVARRLGAQTIVYWSGTPGGDVEHFGRGYQAGRLFDLFDIYRRDAGVVFVDGDPKPVRGLTRIDKRPDWKRNGLRGWPAQDVFGAEDHAYYTVCDPLLLEGERPDDAGREACALLAELTPNRVVRRRVKQIAAEVDLSSMVGVHFRRGDIVGRLAGLGAELQQTGSAPPELAEWIEHFFARCAPADAYAAEATRQAGTGAELLVCSEDPDAAALFSDRARSLAPFLTDLPSVQAAMVEMLALARCGQIISTGSRFGQAAGLIGGLAPADARLSASPEGYLGELSRVMGLTALDRDHPAVRTAADAVIGSSSVFRLSRDLGWGLDATRAAALIAAG